MCACASMCVHVCACVHCVCVYVCVYMHVCLCVCVCVCVNVCGCMLLYFYVCMHLLCKIAHVDTHTYGTPCYYIVKLLLVVVFI